MEILETGKTVLIKYPYILLYQYQGYRDVAVAG